MSANKIHTVLFPAFHFLNQLKEKRLEQEKDLLKKQNEWLDSELNEKSEAFFALKKEKV